MTKKIIGIIAGVVALASGIITFFALSGNGSIGGLLYSEPENIVYDGNYITWNECAGVSFYDVKIDEASSVRANSPKYAYIAEGAFSVTVTAVYEKNQKSVTVTFTPLAKISALSVSDDGVVSWDAVEHADAYVVSVNGQEKTITNTSYPFKEGDNTIKVKPVVKGNSSYFSYWSEQRTVRICKTPSNIGYDGKEIYWTGNSASYEVAVNGERQVVKGNKVAYASEQHDFDIEVIALGDHINSFDSPAATERIRYMQTVSVLFVEDEYLKWNKVEGATGYKIKAGNAREVTIKDNFYKIPAGETVSFSVMPVNDSKNAKYFSVWSAEKNVHILKTPSIYWNGDFAADGGNGNANVIWDAVNGAAGYEVRFTKQGKTIEVAPTDIDGNCFKNPYSEVGEYTVEVKAKADPANGDFYDSAYSSLIRIVRLPAPKMPSTNFIISDKTGVTPGFTVNFMQVANANTYELYKDGVKQNGEKVANGQIIVKNVTSEESIDERTIAYGIRSVGSGKTVSGGETRVVLSSLDMLNFEITVKATPQNLTMSGFNLYWDSVAANNGYSVIVSGREYLASSETYDLSLIAAGENKVMVSCCGNGSNVLASNFSVPVSIKRLEVPSIERIVRDNNGTLICSTVGGATGYSLYFDGNLDNAFKDQGTVNNVYSFIGTSGTTLAVVAEANYYNTDRTQYFMSSARSATKTFIKLKAPQFTDGSLANSKELVWNAPTNVDRPNVAISYEVFDGDIAMGTGLVTGCKCNLTGLKAGDHNMSVRAIGDGTRYVDSDISSVISFTKLEKPGLSVDKVNNRYVWNNIAGATSYYLRIGNGKEYAEPNDVDKNCSYVPVFKNAGTYSVTIKSIGDGRRYIDSDEETITQVVKKLKTPSATARYSSDVVDINNGMITVDIVTPSDNCTLYSFTIDNVTETGKTGELSYSRVIKSTGVIAISVKALGGDFDENGTYYLESDSCSVGNIVLLANPNKKDKILDAYGNFRIETVTNAKSYEYQISYDGGEYGEIKTVNGFIIKIEDYKSYKSIRIRVRATGAGDSRYITSGWTEYVWVNGI